MQLSKRLGRLDLFWSGQRPRLDGRYNHPQGHLLWRGGPGFGFSTAQRSARLAWEWHHHVAHYRGRRDPPGVQRPHRTVYLNLTVGSPTVHRWWAFSAHLYLWGA